MIYPYRCQCGWSVDLQRKIEERDDPVVCADCGLACRRRFVSVHLVANPWAYRDMNRETRSQTEVLEAMRESDRVYEQKWAPNPPKEVAVG